MKKQEIQQRIFNKALKTIFRVIPEEHHSVLKIAKGVICKDYALIIFNDLYAFQYKWNSGEILCVNGAAKSIALKYLKYSPEGVNMLEAEKIVNRKGQVIWKRKV